MLTGKRKTEHGLVAGGLEAVKDPRKVALFGFEEGIGFIPFVGLGYSAVKTLRKDDASPVRAGAAVALANDPDPRSTEALVTATTDKSWVVRCAALDALGKRGDPKLLSRVVPALSDERLAVQYTAAATVIRLRILRRPERDPKWRPQARQKRR